MLIESNDLTNKLPAFSSCVHEKLRSECFSVDKSLGHCQLRHCRGGY